MSMFRPAFWLCFAASFHAPCAKRNDVESLSLLDGKLELHGVDVKHGADELSVTNLATDGKESSSWTDSFAEHAKLATQHDQAHAGHWAALQRAQITKAPPAVSTFNANLSGELTVVVNGRELPFDGDQRPSKVNTNKIEVKVIRRDEFAALKLLLTNVKTGEELMEYNFMGSFGEVVSCCDVDLPTDTVLSLEISWDDVGDREVLTPTFGVAPPKKQKRQANDSLSKLAHHNTFAALLKDEEGRDQPSSLTHTKIWKVVTADAMSGDVQGEALFLPEDYDYETQFKRQIVPTAKLLSKTFTVFDLAYGGAASTFDIRTHGFELENPDAPLKEHVEAFRDGLGMDVGGMPTIPQLKAKMWGDTSLMEKQYSSCMLLTQQNVDSMQSLLNKESDVATCYSSLDKQAWNLEVNIHEIYSVQKYVLPDEISEKKLELGFLYEDVCGDSERALDTGNEPPSSGEVPLSKGTVICIKCKMWAELPASALGAGHLIQSGINMATLDDHGMDLAWKQIFITEGENEGYQVKPGVTMKLLDINGEVKTLVKKVTGLARPILRAQETEAIEWWKRKTGQDVKAACYSFRFRHTEGGAFTAALPIAHIDATLVHEFAGILSSHRVAELLEVPGGVAIDHTVLMFNKWINIGDAPIETLPLMVLDTRTLREEDIDVMWVQNGLNSKGIRWSDEFRWYYTKLQRGQGYVFGTVPHSDDHHEHAGVKLGSPHSAFNIETPPAKVTKPRSSMEFRCMLVDHQRAYQVTDSPGKYVLFADVNETQSEEINSNVVTTIQRNSTRMVEEVKTVGKYVRGRLVFSNSWINIFDTESGVRYAFRRKDVQKEDTESEVPELSTQEAANRAVGKFMAEIAKTAGFTMGGE